MFKQLLSHPCTAHDIPPPKNFLISSGQFTGVKEIEILETENRLLTAISHAWTEVTFSNHSIVKKTFRFQH